MTLRHMPAPFREKPDMPPPGLASAIDPAAQRRLSPAAEVASSLGLTPRRSLHKLGCGTSHYIGTSSAHGTTNRLIWKRVGFAALRKKGVDVELSAAIQSASTIKTDPVENVFERRSRPEHLADFRNPPVAETVLSVQFEPLPFIHAAHLGLLWNEYRAAFPKTEERPPLEPVTEQFPESPAARVGLKFQALESFPIPRFWFTNDQGSEMIQVQSDRFIKNWRKEHEEYPHYDRTIRPHFDRDYKIFLAFLNKNQLGAPSVNQCEVTYVNHILAGEGWEQLGEVDKIFTFWRSAEPTIPGRPEDLRLHTRFVIPDKDGKPIGRLHIDVQPAARTFDHHPMYVLHLTARGQVGNGVDFLDIGREWIVTTFKNITTTSMHEIWRIK